MIHYCEIVQYANYTHSVYIGAITELPDLITRTKTTLSLAKTYFSINGLMINPSTTQCLFVGTRPFIRRIPSDMTINSDNAHITSSNHIKSLGIYMDCHMTFDVHIQEMHNKVMWILFFLNRIKDKFQINTRKIVIHSLALSIINYCLPVYGTTNSTKFRAEGCKNPRTLQQRYVLGELGGLITPSLLSHSSNGSKSRKKYIYSKWLLTFMQFPTMKSF